MSCAPREAPAECACRFVRPERQTKDDEETAQVGVSMVEVADAPRPQDQPEGQPQELNDAAVPDATAPEEPTPAESVLSERDAAILAFEKQWWKYAGAKEQAVRELFDLSATGYYQVLNTLLDSPAALAAEPMLVKRLRRMRASRQRERSQRRSQL